MIPDNIVSLKDLEALCLIRLDPMARDYLYDGAEEGHSIKENLEVWDRYLVIPRLMQDTSNVSLEPIKPLIGQSWKLPLGIAPSAMQQLAHPQGEKASAAAAKAMNVPFALSTFSNHTIEDVRTSGGSSASFFQIYLFGGEREANIEHLKRAKAAGYKAVVLTVDSPVVGTRPALVKSKFQLPPHIKIANFSSSTRGPLEQNVSENYSEVEPVKIKKQPQPSLDLSINWERDISWLKAHTDLEIWVKGVLDPRDAEEAIKYGVDGIWVSNHGGRQLDSSISALDALPAILKTVNGRVPVHLDGGVRRGGDIFRALALGADFVWIGRPIWWGLKMDGADGVQWVLETLEREFEVVMRLMGCKSVAHIRRDMLITKSQLPSMGGSY